MERTSFDDTLVLLLTASFRHISDMSANEDNITCTFVSENCIFVADVKQNFTTIFMLLFYEYKDDCIDVLHSFRWIEC